FVTHFSPPIFDFSLSFSLGGWKWSGCSDNIHFGDKIARQYLDGREIGRDGRAIVNLQNNRAGRLAVKKTMQRLCKCHGVSGSCATKTCWMKLSDFSTVGRHLKKLYARAVKIEFSGYNGRSTEDTALPLAISKINKKHLVYIEPSPNYCRANRTIGVQGTLGRECSRNRGKDVARSQRRSCKSLCKDCGLGIMKKVMTVTKNCNCKFQWCCEVKCDRCVHQTVRYNCRK
ncbi:WNT8B (predicted), partial [Pycnogonum litorale]